MPAMQLLEPYPFYADRNVAFSATVAFFGFDFTGASARMQVRTAPDVGGSPLISLATGGSGITIDYAGTDTVANHIAAGRLTEDDLPPGYTDASNLTLTLMSFVIAKATMALSSAPAEEDGDDVDLAYDVLVTPSGGTEAKYLFGAFIVRGTVTQ